jgi:hypothetical protein
VTRALKIIEVYKISTTDLKTTDHLMELGISGRIILRENLEKWILRLSLDQNSLSPELGSFENGNELSGPKQGSLAERQ